MKLTKKILLSRLQYVSVLAGEEYAADYNAYYGGWCMHLAGTDGTRRGMYGFDDRKTAREFWEYLYGIICAYSVLRSH